MLSVLTFRTPAEAVEKANNTPYGLSAGVWTDKGSRILWMADQLRAGVVWANTFNKFDPTRPFGGYKESGYGREGGRHGLEAYLDALSRRRRLDVRKTYKLYIGGAFPRSRVRAGPTSVHDARGEFLANAALGLPQGRPRRGRGGPRRRSPAGPARRRTTGARSSTGSPRCWRAAAPSSSTRCARRGRHAPQAARRVDAAIDRLVWYAGWADKIAQVVRRRQPGRRAVLQPLHARADRRGRPWSRPPDSSLLGLVSVVAPAIVTGNTVRGRWPRPSGRCRRSPWPRCWPPPTCPAAWSTSSPARSPRSRPWLASHMDVNAHRPDRRGRRRRWRPSWRSRRPRTSSGCSGPAGRADWTADPGSTRMTAFLETKTVWHPKGV